MRSQRVFAGAMLSMAVATAARADVTISTDTTQNMTCSGGVCAPTASSAVLNVNDLEGYLASGNVEVTTTGSGGVQANNIDVTGALSWSTASALTLDAYQSIAVGASVSVEALSGLTLTTNDGGSNGTLYFASAGSVTFADLQSALVIDGTRYRLEKTLPKLAFDIVQHPGHAFALAADYDARRDGLYRASPIPPFRGAFNGLGHLITHLEIADESGLEVGLFFELETGGTISSVGLSDVTVRSFAGGAYTGGLAGLSAGTITNSSVGGRIRSSSGGLAGGVVGQNSGMISTCWSAASSDAGEGYSGALAGQNQGSIDQSFATGNAIGQNSGGLVGINSGSSIGNAGSITNSYATGRVNGGKIAAAVGGLVGYNPEYSTVTTSYSTGHPKAVSGSDVGGFIGANTGTASNSYWDTTTSRTKTGAGYGNTSGITGLTTEELQSGLPSGFDPSIWTEDSSVNNGLPYLINNPPPQ